MLIFASLKYVGGICTSISTGPRGIHNEQLLNAGSCVGAVQIYSFMFPLFDPLQYIRKVCVLLLLLSRIVA